MPFCGTKRYGLRKIKESGRELKCKLLYKINETILIRNEWEEFSSATLNLSQPLRIRQ